jgi:hypothetical protein
LSPPSSQEICTTRTRKEKRRDRADDLIHDSRRKAEEAERRAEAAERRAEQAERWARERQIQESRAAPEDPYKKKIEDIDAERERLYASIKTEEDGQKILGRAKELEEEKAALVARREYQRLKAQEPSPDMQRIRTQYSDVFRHPRGHFAAQEYYFRRTKEGQPSSPETMEAAFEDARSWIQRENRTPETTDEDRARHQTPPRGGGGEPAARKRALPRLTTLQKQMAEAFFKHDKDMMDNPQKMYAEYSKIIAED